MYELMNKIRRISMLIGATIFTSLAVWAFTIGSSEGLVFSSVFALMMWFEWFYPSE